MASGIYCIEHVASGRIYVGSAVDISRRWKEHRRRLDAGDHHSKFLQRSWEKHGAGSFLFRIVLLCDRPNLLWYEQALIDAWKPKYNSAPTAGSQLGFRHRLESRRKMSASNNRTGNPGYVHTEESKRRISQNRRGKGGGPMAAERRAKIGAAHKGRVITPEQRARIAATLTGRKQSRETVEKRALKLRGRKMPAGFARATADRMRGKKLPPGTVLKIARSKAKLTDEQVRSVRTALSSGEKQKTLALHFKVDQSVISTIKTRTAYGWVI
jgi:group I intron endonuclease